MATHPASRKPATKFVAQRLTDLFSPERDKGRLARKAKLIVACEVDDGSWCELDATDLAHAKALAHNWVDKMNARGCSVWHVEADGSAERGPAVYRYYWSPENIDA